MWKCGCLIKVRHVILLAKLHDMYLYKTDNLFHINHYLKSVSKWPGVGLAHCCFVVYSTLRFVLCFTLCHFVLVFFSHFSIAITSLGEGRANLSAFRTFVRFVLVWICRFSLPFGVWEGLRFLIEAHPGLFSYLFFSYTGFTV